MLICLLIGALMAQRLKVLALVPAITLAAPVAVMLGYRSGYSAWEIVGVTVADIICLQFGYLIGAGIHHLITGVIAGSTHHRALDGSVSHRRPAH
jgi:hypothetical protein